jgi:SAM-dependent methyltransferase
MLAVARVATPPDMSIDWQEASAGSLPFADGSFDAVLCQMGLQFFPGQLAALREMHRVLDAGGRAYVTVPGPKPAMFAVMTDALARHIGPDAASFGDLVFSLHDVDEMRELMLGAGFADVDVRAELKTLRLPAPADFLWQYLFSTPVAAAVAGAGEHTRETLEREVCDGWQEFLADGTMSLAVSITIAAASKSSR